MRHIALAAALLVSSSLAGCGVKGQLALSPTTQAGAMDAETAALRDANMALNGYAIAKGIAQVAALAVPTIAAPLNIALALTDTYAARLQAAVSAISLDVPTITALVAQINAQVQTITATAAPAIKVVPAAAPAP